MGCLLLASAVASACPLTPADGTPVVGEGVQLAWRVADGAPIAPSRHFALLVRICPADAELQAVDATMPAHGHGMNYRPTVQRQADGVWRAEGLLFHMRGTWELRWNLRADGRAQSLTQPFELR